MTDYRHEEAFLPNGERNPYYPNPIVPDAIHHGPIHECFPPRPRTVTVQEDNKVAEIRDAFKNLRFKVSLTYVDLYYYPGQKSYKIQVLSYNGYANPMIIVEKPSFDEPPIYDYDYALKLYDNYVKGYIQLVKAETKDFLDIELYKELIGYKVILPKCCFTCKWCKKHPFGTEFKLGEVGRLECRNPKCCQAYKFDSEHRHAPWNEHCHDPKCHDPNYFERDHMCIGIHPNVDMFGVCNNYEKLINGFIPTPNLNIAELINTRVDYRVEETVPPLVSNIISTELTSDLSAPVIQAISMVLSSPEASVALSAPVVKLVEHSPIISSSTVNVIGTALSTNLLSNQMLVAVSATFDNPNISAALELPVANAINTPAARVNTINVIGTALSTNLLSNQMLVAVSATFDNPNISAALELPVANAINTPAARNMTVNVIANALSTNSLSASMIPAVATVIPTNDVSSVIVDVVSKGITIDMITGNNGLKNFIDKNNNGYQDADEPDITEFLTIVLGSSLGA